MRDWGGQFIISSSSTNWKEDGRFVFDYTYFLTPQNDVDSTIVIKAGTMIQTYAMKHLRNQYCNIFFMGENDGFCNTGDLIKQLRSMISYSGTDNYIVISFHKPNKTIPTITRMKEMEDSLSVEFGDHFLNLRDGFVKQGFAIAGTKPTKEDSNAIMSGQVPPQFLLDGLHFNNNGNKVIATLVYNKMKELKY